MKTRSPLRAALLTLCAWTPTLAFAQQAPDWNNPGRETAPIVCFAEGTTDHYVAAIEAYLEKTYGTPGVPYKYQLGNRWTGGQGSNVIVTWSLVPDGLVIPGAAGEASTPSNMFARMNTLFANNTALWVSKIQACFDRWEALSGIDFTRVTAAGVEWDDGVAWGTSGNDTTHGDIRLSMHNIDGVNGILGYTQLPQNGDMVLDSSENWAQGQPSSLFMRNTITHELGHAIGLLHSCPIQQSKLMEPFLSTAFDGPRHDDIRAAQRHYGDDNEPDDSALAAFDIGVLTGTPVVLGSVPSPTIANTSILSIDGNGEQDWYQFTVNGAANLTVTLAPQGFAYLSGPQQQNGACSAGTTIDTKAIDDLAFEVRSSAAGNPILTTVNATAAGSNEVLTNFNLPTAGTYFIRVFENNAPTESQLYTLTVDADPTCAGSIAQGGAGCAGSGGCTPAINMTGCPSSNQTVTFSVSNAVGGATSILLFGLSTASIPAPNGCILRIGTSLPFSVTLPLGGVGNCNGSLSVPTTLPVITSVATVQIQAVCSDAGKKGGFTLSNAIAVTFAP